MPRVAIPGPALSSGVGRRRVATKPTSVSLLGLQWRFLREKEGEAVTTADAYDAMVASQHGGVVDPDVEVVRFDVGGVTTQTALRTAPTAASDGPPGALQGLSLPSASGTLPGSAGYGDGADAVFGGPSATGPPDPAAAEAATAAAVAPHRPRGYASSRRSSSSSRRSGGVSWRKLGARGAAPASPVGMRGPLQRRVEQGLRDAPRGPVKARARFSPTGPAKEGDGASPQSSGQQEGGSAGSARLAKLGVRQPMSSRELERRFLPDRGPSPVIIWRSSAKVSLADDVPDGSLFPRTATAPTGGRRGRSRASTRGAARAQTSKFGKRAQARAADRAGAGGRGALPAVNNHAFGVAPTPRRRPKVRYGQWYLPVDKWKAVVEGETEPVDPSLEVSTFGKQPDPDYVARRRASRRQREEMEARASSIARELPGLPIAKQLKAFIAREHARVPHFLRGVGEDAGAPTGYRGTPTD